MNPNTNIFVKCQITDDQHEGTTMVKDHTNFIKSLVYRVNLGHLYVLQKETLILRVLGDH